MYPEAIAGWLRPVMPEREVIGLADEAAFVDALPDIEVLVAHLPPRGHWATAKRLRLLHAVGAGVDGLLPAVGLPSDVIVANATGVHIPAMSEWIVAALLTAFKGFDHLHGQQRQNVWRPVWDARPLAGSTVCILGLGTIGADVARLLQPFAVRIVGTRRTPAPMPGVAEVFGPDQTTETMRGADAVIVLLPRTELTTATIGPEQLDALKDNAVLVDVSRGGIVDIEAVVERLGTGKLRTAVVDVWEPEPLPANSPFWSVPGLVLTPHTAGANASYVHALSTRMAENIALLEKGEPLISPVDRERGY